MSSSGWNQGLPKRKSVVQHKPAVVRGAVAGLVVVAVASVVAWFFLSDEERGVVEEQAKKDKGMIKAMTPAPAPAPKAEPVKPKPEKKKIPFWELPASQTNGFSEAMQRKWKHMHYPPPCYTNTTALTEAPPEYAIFNHYSENRIACYLTIEPGQTMVGTPVFGKDFEKDFLKSCEEPIIISQNDDEKTKALKRLMNETKIELRQRMADGEKLGDIMSQTHQEVQKLSAVKREIENLVHEQVKAAKSESDYDDIVKAANKMLEERGIAPISTNPIVRRNLRRRLMAK